MTFNSTSPNNLTAAKIGLIPYLPEEFDGVPARRLWVAPDVVSELRGEKPGSMYPSSSADVVLGRFLAGHSLKFSRQRRKRKGWFDKGIEFEQLQDVDEVWAFCYRKPGAGWRVLGRFLEKDVFVIFGIYDKHLIGVNYQVPAEETIARWNAAFGNQAPITGANLETYLSGEHYDLDAKT